MYTREGPRFKPKTISLKTHDAIGRVVFFVAIGHIEPAGRLSGGFNQKSPKQTFSPKPTREPTSRLVTFRRVVYLWNDSLQIVCIGHDLVFKQEGYFCQHTLQTQM